jgi:DHA2 family multidrug resistance protein
MGQLTTSTGANDLFAPLLVRAMGTVLMFLPLSMTTLGPIPKKDIAAATGFYSLTRQLGGSVGVALLSTLLGSRMAFHRAVLTDKLVVSDPDVQARLATLTNAFLAKGVDVVTAKQRALTILDGGVRLQSSVLSFNDIFWITAVLVVATLPLVFALGKPSRAGAAAAAGAH